MDGSHNSPAPRLPLITQSEKQDTCPDHGEFTRAGFKIGSTMRWIGCPECSRLHQEAAKAAEAIKAAEHAQRVLEQRLDRSGNYSSQQYALSPMSKLMKTGIGSGKGLVALDGAAQAGIIRARVSHLPALQAACIVARYAPRFEECPCCQGRDKMTDEYREAVAALTEWAIGHCAGITLRNLRGAIIRSFFERGVSIADAAKQLGVPKATAYDQKARVDRSLKELDLVAQRAVAVSIEDMCMI